MATYDADIRAHYTAVAEESGLAPTSTMADERVRKLESAQILKFVRFGLAGGVSNRGVVADVGCGNGYTLSILHESFPELTLHGFEFVPEMRALAEARLAAARRVSVHAADIRNPSFTKGIELDLVVVQRVLINLLDRRDQRNALKNLVSSLRPGAHIFFIEGFQKGLENLNEARNEFSLPALPPAAHNLLLAEDFFEDERRLEAVDPDRCNIPVNFLSTHYFVARVLHDILLAGRPFSRNSMFVRFMSDALRANVGDFSPIRARVFKIKG
jgi:SAM-dependent methyltransferase